MEGCGSQLDINNNQNNNNNRDKENMGSNVSRHNGKGLSGRRSLSSGKWDDLESSLELSECFVDSPLFVLKRLRRNATEHSFRG